jgi:sugar phosphate isomerase/epimerase
MNLVGLGLCSSAVRSWPSERVVDEARRVGFQGVEWEVGGGATHIPFADIDKRARACFELSERAGLAVPCLSAEGALSILDAGTRRGLVAAAAAGDCRLVRMFAPPVDPHVEPERQLSTLRRALEAHVSEFHEHRVSLLIELSEETLIPSPELFTRVASDLDSDAVGVVYDPANMLVEGNLPPWYALSLLGDLAKHVHIKNEIFVRQAVGWAPQIVGIEDGMVDWPLVTAALGQVGYAGWICIDHLSGPETRDQLVEEHRTAVGVLGISDTHAKGKIR